MRALAAVVIALAACYSPTAPSGAPCDPARGDNACPTGQQCVATAGAHFCELTLGAADAARGDGMGVPGDQDGDGILDAADNCPTVANADQGNEDGDRFGDACDPCPPLEDNAPGDRDGDGVADDCDPRPDTAGDRIVLFEGFHHGVPSGWTQVGATAAQDGVAISAAASAQAFISVVDPSTSKHETVSTHLTITGLAGLGSERGAGVIDDGDPTITSGISCDAVAGALGVQWLELVDQSTLGLIQQTTFPVTVGDVDTLALRRDATAFSCHGTSTGNDKTTNGTSSVDTTAPQVGLGVRGATATFDWIMVVANP